MSAYDVHLEAPLTLNNPEVFDEKLKRCVEAQGLRVVRGIDQSSGQLQVVLHVPDARSDEEAEERALNAVKCFIGGPGARWQTHGTTAWVNDP